MNHLSLCVPVLQVGESISCFVMDVEDGTPLLTQRPPEEAADVYEFLEDLEEQDVDKLSDATLIQGMWLAAENAAGDKDDEAENGDALLEQLDPIEVRRCSVRGYVFQYSTYSTMHRRD